MAIKARCLEATFILTGEKEAERIKGVEVLKHLGRLMERSDYDWPEVVHNIRRERQVQGRLRKLLCREGA